MTFSWTIFVIVLLLGVLQLAVGIVFGRCLPIGRPKPARSQGSNVGRLRHFAGRLFELVNNVADDVDEHQNQIKQVSAELASARSGESGGLTEFVLRTVAKIMQVNERLQVRLGDAEEKLQKQTRQMESHLTEARTDPLTGLPNRRAFDDELIRRVAEWRRKNTIFCLVMLDIDHFKKLNDRYGHPAGDYVLRHVAEVLRTVLREMDMVGRVGGEEFAVILPSTNSPDAKWATERIRSAVASEVFSVEQVELRLTISLGLAMVDSGDDSVSLMKRADEALYTAKRAGRNCEYFHNGQNCERIGPSAQPAQGRGYSLPDSDVPDAAELAAICEDLRQRMAEVTEEP